MKIDQELLTVALLNKPITKKKRVQEKKYESYPDLLTTIQFRQLLGGICDSYARKIIHSGKVTYIRHMTRGFLITKQSALDYLSQM